VATALVVDAEAYRLEAIVRWLDAADARLSRIARPVAPVPRTAPAPERTAARR